MTLLTWGVRGDTHRDTPAEWSNQLHLLTGGHESSVVASHFRRDARLARSLHHPILVATSRFRSPNERRVHRRANLDAPLLLDLGWTWRKVRCRDVSAGGVSVEAEGLLVGAEVDVYVELPSRSAIETRALVVWVDGRASGLRFLHLDPSARLAVTSFCRSRTLAGRARELCLARLAIPSRVVVA